MSHAVRSTFPMPAGDDEIAPAARAAADGPVLLTENGEPAYVLMTHEEYLVLARRRESILYAFEDPGPDADFDFDPPRDRRPIEVRDIGFEE